MDYLRYFISNGQNKDFTIFLYLFQRRKFWAQKSTISLVISGHWVSSCTFCKSFYSLIALNVMFRSKNKTLVKPLLYIRFFLDFVDFPLSTVTTDLQFLLAWRNEFVPASMNFPSQSGKTFLKMQRALSRECLKLIQPTDLP